MREFGVIIDLDGTLIHKGKATLGAKEFIDSLKRNDIPFRIITNSVGRTQSELSDKASMVGIDIDECLIFNPITALDKYLVDNEIDSFLFVGPSKIESNLSVESRVEEEPEFIILSGLEEVNYDTLNEVFVYLKGGAKLLTMSRSEYYIANEGLKLDTGAFTRMLEYHAKDKALLFGKPSSELFDAAIKDMELEASTVCVIGDDVLTDIKGAKECGLNSILVRTGKYQVEDELIEEPGMVVNSLVELLDDLDEEEPRFWKASALTNS